MAHICYLYLDNEEENLDIKNKLHQYAQQEHIQFDATITESMPAKMHWQQRDIGTWFLQNKFNSGDTIVAYQAADMARSTSQMLEILVQAAHMNVNVVFIKYAETFFAKENNKLADLLSIMQHIEGDFIARRTTDALARRRAAGLPLGRPKGRKNKSLKLDQYRKDIIKYLDLGISKASIAKLVNCHPQTLYDWIERHGIIDTRPKKPRKPSIETSETNETSDTQA